jgi:hypothetical protein
MAIEIWKPVAGFEGLYEVSNLGRVKSFQNKKDGHIVSQSISKWGYLLCNLWKGNKCKTVSVHRLVAKAFIPNPKNKPVINHIDCDKTNNRVENLEWTTQKENVHHSVKLGHYENSGAENKPVIMAEKHGHFENRFKSICEAARITGIPQQSISACCNGKLKSAGGYLWRFQ